LAAVKIIIARQLTETESCVDYIARQSFAKLDRVFSIRQPSPFTFRSHYVVFFTARDAELLGRNAQYIRDFTSL